MAGQEQQLTPEQQEAEALLAAQEGYDNKARGAQPPAPSQPDPAPVSAAQPTEQPLADPAEPDDSIPGEQGAQADPEPESAPDPIAAVSEQLGALRAQVKELAEAGGAAAEVRKLHGEIGNINRTLTQLQQAAQAKAADAPDSVDELSAALKQAEEVAEQFPEIAGPLVKALKAMQAKTPTAAPQASAPAADPAPETPPSPQGPAPAVDLEKVRFAARQQMAIEAINELHPDRLEINQSPVFKKWLSAKAPEYQQRVTTTWNPAVLAKCYDEFKAWRDAQKRKQERLDAAAAPQGGGAPAPTTISDEQAAWEGYNARPRRY